jgi:adenosylcobinamide-phosphate synthase
VLTAATAAIVPGCSSAKALRVGWSQHALLPSPNSGWSEAAVAGAIQRKLVGPIWRDGSLVTDVWLGDPSDPPLATDRDYHHASRFVGACGVLAAALACAIVWTMR